MSVKKQYVKSKGSCKVTFRLDKKQVAGAHAAAVAGDFNEWQADRTPMKPLKNGDFTVTVQLDPGREYQYRFVLDGKTWISDETAEKQVHCNYADCENSVVII